MVIGAGVLIDKLGNRGNVQDKYFDITVHFIHQGETIIFSLYYTTINTTFVVRFLCQRKLLLFNVRCALYNVLSCLIFFVFILKREN